MARYWGVRLRIRSVLLGSAITFLVGLSVVWYQLYQLSEKEAADHHLDLMTKHSPSQKIKSGNGVLEPVEGHKREDGETDLKSPVISVFPGDIPSDLKSLPPPNYDVHIFYYPWYGNPEFDGVYLHWNHPYMPHWNKKEDAKWPKGHHKPPEEIGSNFYPELGPYSSRSPRVLENHMRQIRMSGAGVLAVSWYPADQADDNGHQWDSWLPDLFDAAHKFQLKVCLHIEPFKDRNAASMKEAFSYIDERYGGKPAYYHVSYQGKDLPLFYVYDTYLVPAEQWKMLLSPEGALSIRNTDIDAIVVGLVVEERHQRELQSANFDGFYTYFASDGFSFGSTSGKWHTMSQFANTHNMLFIPSIGPGYIDEQIRPWNSRNTKKRKDGDYYDHSFQAAIAAKPKFISITSFNEWGEGTQIETAIPYQREGFTYQDYKPHEPDYYLSLTRKWVHKFAQQKRVTR